MPELALADWIPAPKDIVVPFVIWATLWLANRAWKHLSRALHSALKSWALRELLNIRRIRRNPYAIQRQLIKEAALFSAFLIVSLMVVGLQMTLSRLMPLGAQVVYFSFLLIPVVALEWWWLTTRSFNEELIKDAARLSASFRAHRRPRAHSERRIAARKQRQQAIDKRV